MGYSRKSKDGTSKPTIGYLILTGVVSPADLKKKKK